ncbi:MAG: prepilin-type N-terminal cleavage/methylation domain-containing protein [Trichlorobacter sp.]|jgi:general secretion pathway protein I|nr:prepilin-type N-terminal cleavage/methylation domain-containing protein [Trichlorobacter sp.]
MSSSSSAGFTLLEVLVALAIMAGALTTLVVSFNYHLSITLRDREETTALLLGRSLLDDPEFRTSSENKGDFSPEHPDYKWQQETTNSPFPGLDRYLLTISWQDGARTLALVTYGRGSL